MRGMRAVRRNFSGWRSREIEETVDRRMGLAVGLGQRLGFGYDD